MEIIIISQDKIKVMLTSEDMDFFSLDAQSMDYNMENTRVAINEILRAAGEKTGFEWKFERIYVQAFPCRKGGCELYVTKLKNSTAIEPCKKDQAEINAVFDNLSSLVGMCNLLSGRNFITNDCIYYDGYTGKYILSFKINCISECDEAKLIESVIREFKGNIISAHTDFSLGEERYCCLCGVNAVKLFSKMASKVWDY